MNSPHGHGCRTTSVSLAVVAPNPSDQFLAGSWPPWTKCRGTAPRTRNPRERQLTSGPEKIEMLKPSQSLPESRAPVNLDSYRKALDMHTVLTRFGVSVNGSRHIPCFIHGDRNPSLKIYPDHIFCFGCGAHMDVISAVQHFQDCDFWGALDWIAEESGLPRPRRDVEAQKRHETAKGISDTYALVFADSLNNPEPALLYLEGRGIGPSVLEGLAGYLPADYEPLDRTATEKAGLYSQKGNFLFADRVIIPIYAHGRIVNLYGRAIDPEREPKHIYCATTDPPQEQTLFGLDRHKKEPRVYLVEAVIDCLTLWTHGLPAISSYGTQGLTDTRVKALKQTSIEKVALVFDTDANNSGQNGALKAGEKLFRAGFDVEIVSLPLEPDEDKQDVNSYFQSHTREDFDRLSHRDFFEVNLAAVPQDGTPREKYRALEPALRLVASQPELQWREYIDLLHKRCPGYDKRKLEKAVSDFHKGADPTTAKREKFLPLDYTEKIRTEAAAIFFDGRFYRYDLGAYRPWYEQEIDQQTIAMFGPEVQPSHLNAVRAMLESVCFIRPENVNPSGLLNLKNGVLNLASGQFLQHSPQILTTVQSEAAFDKDAECPLWVETVAQILPDPEMRHLLAQIFGYCLTPDNSQQKGFILTGEGANGKSAITDVLEALAGRENCSALHLSDFKERFRLAELQNKLINFTTEVEAKGLVNDARLKGVITGDPITAERKQQDPFVFRPFVKLVISCNSLPATADKTHGYFRRWIILPFTRTFSEKRGNLDRSRAQRIIRTELPGVLNWAIGGYKSLMDAGALTEPTASKEALEQYRRDTDSTLMFVDECLQRMSGTTTPYKEIYAAYTAWIKDTGLEPLGVIKFRKSLQRAAGTEARKIDKYLVFDGLTIRP